MALKAGMGLVVGRVGGLYGVRNGFDFIARLCFLKSHEAGVNSLVNHCLPEQTLGLLFHFLRPFFQTRARKEWTGQPRTETFEGKIVGW